MTVRIKRGKSDPVIERIKAGLQLYEKDHPQSKIDLYRHDPVSVRVRIVDPAFQGRDKVMRSDSVWKYLDTVPEDDLADVSVLILLAPGEEAKSLSNLEFEDPLTTAP